MRCVILTLLASCTSLATPLMQSNSSPLAGATMVGFVATTNSVRCRQFYEQQLGFRVVSEDPMAITFDAVGNPLRVQKLAQHTPQQFTILGWNVSNLDAVLDRLEATGVQAERFGLPMQDARGIASFPGGARLVWLKDPDGNVLSVAQMTP
jgi:predicted enzyme related to lactoylglutathione lyase